MRSIHYFQIRTVPAVSGLFDTGLWDSLPLLIGQMEPAVLRAVITLGAYHELSEKVGPKDYWDLHRSAGSDPTFRFASEQYAAAISSFRNILSSSSLSAAGIEILCILFACVEFLRGDRDSALVHISGALGFVKSRQQKFLLNREEAALKSLLARVSLTQSLYGRPRGVPFPDLLDLHKEPAELHKVKFRSLNEARIENTSLLNSTLRFVQRMVYGYFRDPFTALAAQRNLERKLENWSVAFEAFIKDSDSSTSNLRGTCLLRTHHLMAKTFIAAAETRLESAFDHQLSNFTVIVTSIEAILLSNVHGESSDSSSFSLDLGIIPPLFYTAIKCRSPDIRRRAIALLRRAPRQDGLWDAIESAKAAELAMDFEEQQVAGGMPYHATIPEWARVHDIDIHGRDPSDPSKQLVILRWKPDGIDKEVQEVRTYIQW